MTAFRISLICLACVVQTLAPVFSAHAADAETLNTRANTSPDFQGGHPSIRTIMLSELPAEAKETLALIKQGGPFPYPKDGVVFGNREGRLPHRARGYYKEYTVKTPGRRDRGARRIVAGAAGEFYYTDDHYASFKLIKE
jgi:ribonuclease T1